MAIDKIQKNLNWIILAIAVCFIMLNYFFVFIVVKSFQGFNVSGHPIFYMVPFAFSTYICFGIVLLSGILYLWRKDMRFDFFLVSGAQTGVVVGAITIIVGIIWSKPEWGYWWQWEPRQTATLIMWLAYVGLLIFRELVEERDHERKATLSAIFGIATSPSVPLSNFVVGALHPPPQQTELGSGVVLYLMLNFLFIGTLTLILVFMAFRVNKINFKLKEIRQIMMEEA
ncbi:MAG: cytochrome c biogenesis protein CcsA [Candidatus Heimdallarchaeota archaeon]|nr:MAG: cytochrome c biogenesis protein CcsA [Candidatus Heimdallarchaeota archaeon]